jgi:hypothetical protein
MRLSNTGWIIIGVLAFAAIAAGLAVFADPETSRQDHLCWDGPSAGTPPAKYVVTVDGGTPIETTLECVRMPPGVQAGEHIAVVQAVDALGQMSPPASVRFVEP